MKIFENGKLVKNTNSTKNRKSKFAYKGRYQNQLSVNKGLLIVIAILLGLLFAGCIGSEMRYKAETTRLQRLATIGLEQADQWSQYAQMLETKLLTPDSQDPQFIIEKVFGKDAGVMKEIARCESGFNAKARNKHSSAVGLFQILSYAHNVNAKYLEDPMINALIAKKLFDASGTQPWVSSISCWNK